MELSNYRKWLAVSYDEFMAVNGSRMRRVTEHVWYEKLTEATRVDGSDNEFFFFRQGTLSIIYISDEALTGRLWREFMNSADTTKPEKTVRSRAGKTSNQLIFAAHGITVSLSSGNVDFIEIYPPCSLTEYLEHVYREPGLFIR